MSKNKMASKLILLVLTIIMIGNTTAFAKENGENIKTTLTLEEAISVGIENSPDIELNKINMEKLKVELSEARATERSYRQLKKYDPYNPIGQMEIVGTMQGFQLEEEAASKNAEYEIEEASMTEEYIIKSLESGITQSYYGVLQAKDGVDVQKVTLANLQRNYEILKRKLELGMSSKSEFYMTEISLNEGIVNLSKAEDTYRRALRGINNVLNYPLDTKLELTSDYKETDSDIELEKDLEYAFENRYDLINQQNDKELAELNFTVTKRRYTPNTYKYKYAESTVKMLENRLNNHMKNIESDIKGKHDEIKTAKEEIKLMNSNIEKAEEGLRLANLQYELGTGTSLEVNEAILNLNRAELGKASAVANYNTSLIEYDRAVNIGQL